MTVACFDTIFPADSVEFCPHPKALNIFACGTYQLDQPNVTFSSLSAEEDGEGHAEYPIEPRGQHRQGKCLLFEIDSADRETFSQIQEIALPAVPDMRWCHTASSLPPILGVADSEGNITLLEYQPHNVHLSRKRLEQIQTVSCAPSHVLCLSLDWSNRRNPSMNLGSLITSLSSGSLALLRQTDHQSGLSVTDTWVAHEYEPWIAAWDYWDTNIVYSGGDDLKLKGWDVRQGFSQPTFVNKRFDAGVTTIQSHPYIEHLLAVGSYDSTVKLFDTRNPFRPLAQADVGGGAWRVKWHPSPSRKDDLLVACMHDGFKVLRFNSGADLTFLAGSEVEIIKRFDRHASLAYGVDWSYGSADIEKDDETLIASCSFYDHALHLWRG